MNPKATWIDGIEDDQLRSVLTERDAKHRRGGSAFAPTNRGGSDGFVFLRPICTGNDCPDPPLPPPDNPCAGQPFVWQPDLAARLVSNEDCPTRESLDRLQQIVAGNLSKFKLPDPEVRASCNNRVIDILIWGTRVKAGSCSDEARKRAQVPDDIAAGGNFGVYISAGLIRQLAHAAFDAAPKQLYANGFPGPGPIHLTGLGVSFQSPNIVKTVITGYDDRPWPDVGFTTTITDTLLEQRGCTTASDTVPSRFDEVLAALFALVSAAVLVYVPVLMPLPAFVIWTDLHDLDRPDNPSDGGVGCRILEGLPPQIALPETGGLVPPTTGNNASLRRAIDVFPKPKKQKLVIPYNQPRVDDRGILASAFISIVDRVPNVAVAGPKSLWMDLNAPSTYAYFGAHNEDFFGDRTYSWTAGTDVLIASPNAGSTKITFLRGHAKPGDHFDRTVTVTVRDGEGSTATASLVVTVFAAEPGDTPPPVCKVKPWLEECSPAG